MGLTPYPIPTFGGLNLTDDAEEVGAREAIDLLNVDLDTHGIIRTRRGLQAMILNAPLGAGDYHRITEGPGGFMYGIRIADSGGIITTHVDRSTAGFPGLWTNIGFYVGNLPTSLVRFGTPTTDYLYIADPQNPVERVTSAALTTPATMGAPGYLAVSATSNRLVQGWYAAAADSPSGANGSRSTVFFSNPGAPETYTATNFVQIRPGDGEEIHAIVTWENLTFVFKETIAAVFYSEDVGPTGLPVFNYRTITLPTALNPNLIFTGKASVVVGTDGVYFVGTRGIYRTRGNTPELISGKIHNVFHGSASDNYQLAADTTIYLSWADEHLYLHYTAEDTTAKVLVWDRLADTWTSYEVLNNTTIQTVAAILPTTFADDPVFIAAGTNVYRFRKSFNDDASTGFDSYYQSGFYAPAPGLVSTLRMTKLWGSGGPTLNIFTDHASNDPLTRGAAVTLGVFPSVIKGYHKKSYQGELFSFKVSLSSGAWALHRLEHDLLYAYQPQ